MIVYDDGLRNNHEEIRDCLRDNDRYQYIYSEHGQTSPLQWRPDSWNNRENVHPLPFSPQDERYLQCVVSSQYLQLIDIEGIIAFKKSISKAAFIIQGGYCAESFSDANCNTIYSVVDLLLEMKNKIFKGIDNKDNETVLLMPRMAGQYAKPRSYLTETSKELNQVVLSYRGDMIHGYEHTCRTPDPGRVLHARQMASKALEILRGKYNDLMTHSDNRYPVMGTCHEAFCLWYEQLNTRMTSMVGGVNTGAYFLWLGEMTGACLNGAHVEYLRGIENPIGIKVGPRMTCEHLCSLLRILNPDYEHGKICLITRLGTKMVRKCLPGFIHAVKGSGYGDVVRWICDPMHGNTEIITQNEVPYKVRYLSNIFQECYDTFNIHRMNESICSGLHLEYTGENCFECITDECDLIDSLKYTTKCDPRLNPVQLNQLFDDLLPNIIDSIQAWHQKTQLK